MITADDVKKLRGGTQITAEDVKKIKASTTLDFSQPQRTSGGRENVGGRGQGVIPENPNPPPTVGERLSAFGKGIQGNIASSYRALPYVGGQAAIDLVEGTKTQVTSDRMRELDANKPLNPFALRPTENKAVEQTPIEQREEAQKNIATASQGLGRAGEFIVNTAGSIAQNAAVLPTAIINPALPLAFMGTSAAGSRAMELSAEGKTAGEAFTRGLISGGIEAITEKIPLDNLLKALKSNKSVIKGLLQQAGVEATEEAASYVLNFIADKAAKDPLAKFSFMEMAEQALAGGISGGVMGGGFTVAGKVINPVKIPQNPTATNVPHQIPTLPQNAANIIPEAKTQNTQDLVPPVTNEPVQDVVKEQLRAYAKETIPDATDAEIEQIINEMEAPMQAADTAFLDRVQSKFGVEFDVQDINVQDAEAFIQGNKIILSPTATQESVVRGVVLHELTHLTETSQSYGELKTFAVEQIPDFSTQAQAKMAQYKERGVTLSQNQAEAEVVAEYVRNTLFADPAAIEKLVAEKPTVARQLYDAIVAMIEKLKGIVTGAEMDSLEQGRRLFEKALNTTNTTAKTEKLYSLTPVPEINPTQGWERGENFDSIKSKHPTLFNLDAESADTRNPTQITGTISTYRKIYNALKAENFNGTILDASSGLGLGASVGVNEYGFNVDDIEPFPSSEYTPKYTDYATLNNQYDVVISNAVLNVIPQDIRDAMVVKIGSLLKPDGRAFINVRGNSVKTNKSNIAINDNLMEYFVSNTGSYQKGFTKTELVSYLKDALGDNFDIKPSASFGDIAAVVTKIGDPDIRYSITPSDKAKIAAEYKRLLQEYEQRRTDSMERKKDALEEKKALDPPKVAEVLIQSDKQKPGIRQILSDAKDVFLRKFEDSGNTINTIGKITGDGILYKLYNWAKQGKQAGEYMIGEAQTDTKGDKVGQSLKSIFDPIRARGDGYFKAFSEYLFHLHNVDRMSIEQRANERYKNATDAEKQSLEKWLEKQKNKPVFGESVGAQESIQQSKMLEQQYPEFRQMREQVYTYNKNLMQYRIDSGLISQESADLMNEMYPHYVPTFRQKTAAAGAKSLPVDVRVNQTVKKAKGGDSDLMPIDESMARQTMNTVKAARINTFGLRLLKNTLDNSEDLGRYVRSVYDSDVEYDIDADIDDAPARLDKSFNVYADGKPVEMILNSGVFEGVKALSPDGERNIIMTTATEATNLFKRLTTGWSPVFMLRNFSRDLQDAGLYTTNIKEFAENYPIAWKEITTNGELWQKYKALGGTGSSFFDYDIGIMQDHSKLRENTIDKIEALNMMVEQAPRFAEFLTVYNKEGNTQEGLAKAMYAAADITVNFGRSGTWGRTMNRTFVPFFNPSVQGFSKMIREFSGAKGTRKWTQLVIKAAALGIAPELLSMLLYDDDDEYKKISDWEKDTNYLFKIRDGLWAKVPKGRVLSIMQSATRRGVNTLRGKDDEWAGFIELSLNQQGPINPAEGFIAAQLVRSDLFDSESPGKTWFGGDIESQRLRNLPPGERYDESTDLISKGIGGITGLSPKKINNLLDSYTGVIGDFVLPTLTPRAEQNPFAKAFTLDPVISNGISQDFYDTLNEVTQDKNSSKPTEGVEITSRFLNKQSSAASEVYKEIRVVENSDLTDKEKRAKTRELREVVNIIQQNALDALPAYEEAAKKYQKMGYDVDDAYREANRETFGSEYALRVYNKEIYAKAQEVNKALISYDTFYDVYFAQKDVGGDKDKDGKTIALSASKNKKKVIDDKAKSLTDKQKQILYEMFNVSESVWGGSLPQAPKPPPFPTLPKNK
jgi:hypothetical protein